MKWATIDLCEPITKLFNIVAREGFLASWTTNNIQMIFKVKVSYVNFYRCELYLKQPLTPPHTKPSAYHTPNHRLVISTKRWSTIPRASPRDDRVYHFCSYNVVEIEAHFVLGYPLYNFVRDRVPSLF
jgi:hypothetical protein